MDSERELDILLTRDVVYVQGYDFGRELSDDDYSNAEKEIAAIKAHQKRRGSARPYGILAYRGIVNGPQWMWQNSQTKLPDPSVHPEFHGFWLTDDNGTLHPGLWGKTIF